MKLSSRWWHRGLKSNILVKCEESTKLHEDHCDLKFHEDEGMMMQVLTIINTNDSREKYKRKQRTALKYHLDETGTR